MLQPECNSFGVIRLLLALAVLISHAVFLQTGSTDAEPLVALTGYSLGMYGVQGFFILSGILVTQSLVHRGDVLDYGRARAMRIVPGLIACVLLTALVAGPLLSALGVIDYFGSSGLVAYLAKTLSLSTGSASLPGLFEHNPAAGVVNQSLWTLKYEVSCYALLGILAVCVWRFEAQRLAVQVAVAIWALVMLAWSPNLLHEGSFPEVLAYFTLFFGTGVTAFLLRHTIRLNWLPLPALGLVGAMACGTQFAEIASALFIGYGMLWLATFRFGPLRTFANANDYSYGTYIYSFPVSQAVLQFWPHIDTPLLVLATLAGTLVLAALSWRFVERPALHLVRRWRERAPPSLKAERLRGILATVPDTMV